MQRANPQIFIIKNFFSFIYLLQESLVFMILEAKPDFMFLLYTPLFLKLKRWAFALLLFYSFVSFEQNMGC